MMKVKIVKEPETHIVIDDFLSTIQAREVLEECIAHEKDYEVNDISYVYPDKDFDGCPQCVEFAENYRNSVRRTDVFYVDKWVKKHGIQSKILSNLHTKLFKNKQFMDMCQTLPLPFNLIPTFNFARETVSRYGKCEFYSWHTDNINNPYPSERIVTCVYYCNKEPSTFEGGDLLYCGKKLDHTEYLNIKPKHNRAVLFASDDWHAVDTVTLSNKFDESRFSVNMWLGVYSRDPMVLGVV